MPDQGSGRPARGKLVSSEQGKATAYALNMLEDRGELFIQPGDEVYVGQIIGEVPRHLAASARRASLLRALADMGRAGIAPGPIG